MRAHSTASSREPAEVYVRFSAGPVDADSHHQTGIFRAAHPHLASRADRALLDESVRWFNEHLTAPTLDEPRAIFWFRAESAGECVRRVWHRVALLREQGIVVRMLRCTDPGRVVYRDERQVAAVPHRDARWRERSL